MGKKYRVLWRKWSVFDLKNTDFNRISGRINVDQTINDYIKAGATMYAHREQSNPVSWEGVTIFLILIG